MAAFNFQHFHVYIDREYKALIPRHPPSRHVKSKALAHSIKRSRQNNNYAVAKYNLVDTPSRLASHCERSKRRISTHHFVNYHYAM